MIDRLCQSDYRLCFSQPIPTTNHLSKKNYVFNLKMTIMLDCLTFGVLQVSDCILKKCKLCDKSFFFTRTTCINPSVGIWCNLSISLDICFSVPENFTVNNLQKQMIIYTY